MSNFTDGETLPNGVFVHRLINFTDLDDKELPWFASINIASWHYSQVGETKEKAVENLYLYMDRVRKDFQDIINIKTEQLKAVTEFLNA